VVAGKAIIGLVGGIGSGKSFVARIFAEFGCEVIDSDAHARAAFRDPKILATLRQWWGPAVFLHEGQIDRQAIARKVFADPAERRRLEELIHPWVNLAREREMKIASENPAVLAFVWDSPLLFEAGLNRQCDAVVFVEAPEHVRLGRVGETRGWGADELSRRENSQWPLDKKRELSDYVLKNTADAAQVRDQVRLLLSRITEFPD
jgi:dephospho-CoA kinase